MGTQRIRPALFRSNLRDSHFQTGGIATDLCRKYTHFSFLQRKNATCTTKKNGTAFPVTKVGDSAKLKLVLFSTCFQFPCSSLSKGKSLFMLK